MTDEKDCFPLLFKFLKLMVALRLEKHISHGKRLVHDQDLRIDIDGHRKGQAHEHTAGIGLHGLIHIVSDICKIQDVLQLFIDFLLRKADHGAVQINIFNAVVFIIKARAKLQQSGNASVHLHGAGGGIEHAGDDFQNGGFSGAVGSDNSHAFTLIYVQIHIVQSEMLPIAFFSGKSQRVNEPVPVVIIQAVYLIQSLHVDGKLFCLHIVPSCYYSQPAGSKIALRHARM